MSRAFIIVSKNELMAFWNIVGSPTLKISFTVENFSLNFLKNICISNFLTATMMSIKIIDKTCPETVAIAAPITPSAGKPISPKIIIGSKIMFVIAPISWDIMGIIILPIDCIVLEQNSSTNTPTDTLVTMAR